MGKRVSFFALLPRGAELSGSDVPIRAASFGDGAKILAKLGQ
jgi:hypothetical protein